MKYKLSNIAPKEVLETSVGLPLRYPKIYKRNPLITGTEEVFLPVITSKDEKEIEYGIWGLLPENYNEDWSIFQKAVDTLTITQSEGQYYPSTFKVSKLKRCAIVVTGFFTTYLYKGQTYPYYIYAKNEKPFYLAAYYNTLDDGFITFSILLSPIDPFLKQIQNLSDFAPKILSREEVKIWNSETITPLEIERLIEKKASVKIYFHTIGKELFNMNIDYESMLDHVKYDNLPSNHVYPS